MEKRLYFSGIDSSGSPVVEALRFNDDYEGGKVKTAALKTDLLHPDLAKYISTLSSVPGKLYVLIYALGAGEFWGANLNADWVSEKVLKNEDPNDGYKSFLNAGVYAHHANKDKDKSFGKIIISIYNTRMHRVELLVEIDRARAKEFGHQDIVDRLDNGEHPAVSMGLRTPYDICSICGHECKTSKTEDYCKCLQLLRGKIIPDGRRVFMINPCARFFDISFVLIGADPSAFAVAKVASFSRLHAAAFASEPARSKDSYLLEKTAALRPVIKSAAITKRLPVMERFQRGEDSLPRSLLNRLGSQPLPTALSTVSGAGIVLKPQEFTRIVLVRMGKDHLADELDDNAGCFCPHVCDDAPPPGPSLLSPESIDRPLLQDLMPLIPERAAVDPVLTIRIQRFSPDSFVPEPNYFRSPILDEISRGYDTYRQGLLQKIEDLFRFGALQEPQIVDSLNLGQAVTKTASAEGKVTVFGVLPSLYLLTHFFQKATGDERTTMQKFLQDHPYITASVLMGLSKALK